MCAYKVNLHSVVNWNSVYNWKALAFQKFENKLLLVPDVVDLPGAAVAMCISTAFKFFRICY